MDPQTPGQQQTPGQAPGYYPPPVAQGGGAPTGQPDLVKRGIAAFIDFVVIGCVYGFASVALAIVLGSVGVALSAVVGIAAVLVRDVVFQGNSLGKKLMGLAVVNAQGGPITMEQSARRNITLCIGMAGRIFAPIPFLNLLAAGVFGLAGFALGVYELYNVVTNQPRLGDKLAGGTHVVTQGQAAIAL